MPEKGETLSFIRDGSDRELAGPQNADDEGYPDPLQSFGSEAKESMIEVYSLEPSSDLNDHDGLDVGVKSPVRDPFDVIEAMSSPESIRSDARPSGRQPIHVTMADRVASRAPAQNEQERSMVSGTSPAPSNSSRLKAPAGTTVTDWRKIEKARVARLRLYVVCGAVASLGFLGLFLCYQFLPPFFTGGNIPFASLVVARLSTLFLSFGTAGVAMWSALSITRDKGRYQAEAIAKHFAQTARQ